MDPADLVALVISAFLDMLALLGVIYGLTRLLEWQESNRLARKRINTPMHARPSVPGAASSARRGSWMIGLKVGCALIVVKL